MRYFLIALISVLIITSTIKGSNWQFFDTFKLPEIVDGEYHFFKTTLSPDGNRIAWIEPEELCIHDLISASTNCEMWAWEPYFMASQLGHRNIFMQWSPNGQYIAISQDPFLQRYDADIWIFDTNQNTFRNLTEDNIYGQTISLSSDPQQIDYMPLWFSQNEILFFRTTAIQELERAEESGYFYEGLWLMSVSIESGETTFILDLSDDILAGYSAAAIAPSGNLLAVIGQEIVDNPLTTQRFGLWVIDIENQFISKLSSQATWEDLFANSFTPINAYPNSNRSVGWSNDSNIVFSALTWRTEQNTLIPTQFATDINSGNTLSIVNYDNSEQDLSNELFSFVTIIPHSGLTVNYIALSREDGIIGLYSTKSPGINLGVIDFSANFPDGISRMAANGNTLIDETTVVVFENMEN